LLFSSNDPHHLISSDPRQEFYLTESHEDLLMDIDSLSASDAPSSLDQTLSFLNLLLEDDFG
jgi:hypothetical protein